MTSSSRPQPHPLPEDWEARDALDGFFEYIAHCRAERQAGFPLPAMFVPRDDAGALADMCRGMPNDVLDDLIDEAAGRLG